MLSHVCLGIGDFTRALMFYQGVMRTLGMETKFVDHARPWAGFKHPDRERPLLIIGPPFDGGPASAGNGQLTGLLATTRAMVDKAYAVALALGGTCEGPPGLRPEYHPDYYGAYFRDPDGNKLCVCCHHGETVQD